METISLVQSLQRALRLIDTHSPMIMIVRELQAFHRHIQEWFRANDLDINANYETIPLPTELRNRVFFRTGADRMRAGGRDEIKSQLDQSNEPEGPVSGPGYPANVQPLHSTQSLKELVREADKRFNALTPLQQEEHRAAQRDSFVRGMTSRCEHGELDWEQCVPCRSKAKMRIALKADDPTLTDKQIDELFQQASVK